MPVMPRPDEARRTLLIDWLASIGPNGDDIPDNPERSPSPATVSARSTHWLEIVHDDGKPVIDEPNQTIVTRAREKSTDATPPGWDEEARRLGRARMGLPPLIPCPALRHLPMRDRQRHRHQGGPVNRHTLNASAYADHEDTRNPRAPATPAGPASTSTSTTTPASRRPLSRHWTRHTPMCEHRSAEDRRTASERPRLD